MVTTHHGEYKAIVKESHDGTPFIWFELLRGDTIPDLSHASIGFTLVEGTSYQQAQELATGLTAKLKGMFLTKP
jgi:hypothetical protein